MMFTKLWEKQISTQPLKRRDGTSLPGIGFYALSYGSAAIPAGAQTTSSEHDLAGYSLSLPPWENCAYHLLGSAT